MTILALTGLGDPARLGDQVGDRHVPAAPAGVVDRTVGTAVVASILHFQKGSGAGRRRRRRRRTRQLIGRAGGDDLPPLCPEARAHVYINPLYHCCPIQYPRLSPLYPAVELRVAPRHGNDGFGIKNAFGRQIFSAYYYRPIIP